MRYLAFFLLCVSSAFAAGELSGRRAPGFALMDVTTFKYHDPADYRGKVLIVEIMQSTCPHCAVFAQVLEKAKAKYGDRIAVLSITNPPDNQTTVAEYRRKNKVTAPVLYDCGQVAGSYLKITPQNPSFNIPHVFLIDAQGMIRSDFGYGPLTKSIFEGDAIFAEIDKLLPGVPAGKKK